MHITCSPFIAHRLPQRSVMNSKPAPAPAAEPEPNPNPNRTAQVNPNLAPHAASPLVRLARDRVFYEQKLDSTECRGTSLIESCIIDRVHKGTWVE